MATRMLGLEEFSRTVSQVQAAASAPHQWERTLSDIADLLGAKACTLATGTGSHRAIYSTNIDLEATAAYEDYFYQHDFVAADCERSPVGQVSSGWSLVAENKNTEFHVDWQRRYGMTDGFHVRLSATNPSSLFISAPPDDEPFETSERLTFVNALIPHIRRALATQRHLQVGSSGDTGVDAAMDLNRHAVIVVAGTGRIIRMNSAALRLIADPDGLLVRGDRVEASLPAVDRTLQAAVMQALPRRDGAPRTSDFVVCERLSGGRPFLVRTVPLDNEPDPDRARAAVVVIDADQELRPPTLLLKRLFGLTATEQEVALRILRGDDLKTIAESLTVSLATVKTHVQRIFSKTDTHRQVELVRLLTAVSS